MLKRFCKVLIPCKLKKKNLWVLINFGIAMVGSPLICVLLIYMCVVNLFMGNDKSMDYISEIVMN